MILSPLPLAELTPDERALFEAARAVSEHAYCRYSGYAVGAAVRCDSGRIYSGCNVENASYGATICAERAAVLAMVSAGDRRIVSVCVYAPGAPLPVPCGMCRQVIAEFCHDAAVLVAGPSGVLRRSFAELLPDAFHLEQAPR